MKLLQRSADASITRAPRLPAWIIPTAVVLALASGAAGLVSYAHAEHEALEARLTSGVGRARQAVSEWEQRELERVQRWAAQPDVVRAAGAIPAALSSYVTEEATENGIRAVALFTPQGALLGSTAPRLLTDPMLGQRAPAIQRARAGTPSVAGPIRPASAREGSAEDARLLVSAAPVLDATGAATAVLAFFYDVDAPLHRLRTAPFADTNARIHLVDARGLALTGGESALAAEGPPVAAPPVDRAMSRAGTTSGVEARPYADISGRSVVGAWGPADPFDARVAFELEAGSTVARLPFPIGFALAGLLGVAALLVLVQQRALTRLGAAMRAGQDELAVVVESVPNAVLITDERGVVIRANQRAAHLLDAPAATLVGSSLERWLSCGTPFRGDSVDAWLRGIKRDAKARRADGDEVPVEVRSGPGERDGRGIHIVALLDCSVQRGAEDAARDALREAERARRSQTELLSVMSQEIRTPMSRVMGMAHLLKDSSLSNMQQGYVESLMRSAQLLMTFVTDVIDLSKIESGALQLIEAPFDVRAAVLEVADLCRDQARANGTALETRIAERTPTRAIGDAGRLRQILINLIGNGIKFAPSGRVEVRADGGREGTDVVLNVSVRDNGPGMDQETLRRLLTKDHTTVSKLSGGGLGVSMAKHLVELMRGRLGVQSLQGEGTTFKFTVTLRAAEGQDAVDGAPAASLAGTRALVVDSSAAETQVTREWLRGMGMRVESTTTPEEAIGHLRRAAAEGDPVEIALVDRQTLGEQGDAFARRLRADPAIAGVGLLIATDGIVSAERLGLGAAGCDAVLAKPFGPRALARTLAAVVERPREERGRGPLIRGETLEAPPSLRTGERADGQIPIIEEPSARRGPAPRPLDDVRLRVLLAEDNRVNQIIATNLLQRLECRVEVVSDGAAAVRQASRQVFDVILMDIQMPHMDGLAATGLIRRLAAPHGCAHVIALGTSASPEERDRYLAAGMNDVVLKPLTPEALQAALGRRPAGRERVTEPVER